MPTNARSFLRVLRDDGKENVERDLVEHHRKLHLRLLTAVDTGFARSNWQSGVNQTNESQVRGIVQPETVRYRGEQAIADLGPFQTTYIFNNADYINRLNDGSSAQAAAGFVESAIAEVTTFGV